MKKLSSVDKTKLPYSLLLDPLASRAAAYTNTHLLITEEASPALVEYARAHAQKTAQFDPKLHAADRPARRPLPAWAAPEVLKRCVVVWIKRPTGDDPDEAWLAIPPR